jgi:hypothetical protein
VESLVTPPATPATPPPAPTNEVPASDAAPQHIPEAASSLPADNTASKELEVSAGREIDQGREETPRSTFGQGGSLHFESVAVGSDTPLMQVPKAAPKRTAHLGYRVTDEYLQDIKKKTHLLAAMHGVSVDTVNIFILQVLADSFGTVDERLAEYTQSQK